MRKSDVIAYLSHLRRLREIAANCLSEVKDADAWDAHRMRGYLSGLDDALTALNSTKSARAAGIKLD